MDSVSRPFNECIKYLVDNIKLDPHFNDFLSWAIENNVPVVVLTSGMEPIVTALLKHLCGKNADYIQVVGNNVEARPGKSMDEEGGWQIVFHDDRSVTCVRARRSFSLRQDVSLIVLVQRLRSRQVTDAPPLRQPARE